MNKEGTPAIKTVDVTPNGDKTGYFRMSIPKDFSNWLDINADDRLVITAVEKGGRKYMVVEREERPKGADF